MHYVKNSHCSYCGSAFADDLAWPRTCGSCGQVSYLNPTPVAVLLLPVDRGLLVVRRDFGRAKGKLALPGGFVDVAETWQEAAAREVFEEAGVRVDPEMVRDFRVLSAPDGTILIFGVAAPTTSDRLGAFTPNAECSERVVLDAPAPLAFPLHERVVEEYFAGRRA
jgi:ADP-ribose pyrophosphatase YjhB (NUDIX family)